MLVSAPAPIDPLRIFEVKGLVCQIQAAVKSAGVANNTQVIAAVSGKKLRVMGWIMQSGGAAVPTISFKSASGGNFVTSDMRIPVITDGILDKLPIIECGYFETGTGEGLFCDVAGDSVNMTIFYIVYTP